MARIASPREDTLRAGDSFHPSACQPRCGLVGVNTRKRLLLENRNNSPLDYEIIPTQLTLRLPIVWILWEDEAGAKLVVISPLAGAYFTHHSNLGMTDPKPGIDALGFTLECAWKFRARKITRLPRPERFPNKFLTSPNPTAKHAAPYWVQ